MAQTFRKCSCGKSLVFLRTEKGKYAPVIFSSLPEGHRERIERWMQGKVVELPKFDSTIMTNHFTDCPDRDKYHKPQVKK